MEDHKSRYGEKIERNFILIIAILFLLLTAFVLKDIFSVIIFSIILAYFLTPLYNYFLRKTNNKKKIASILTLGSFTVIIFVPLIIFSYFLVLNLIKIIVDYKFYIENPEALNAAILEFSQQFTNSDILASVDLTEAIKSIVLYVVEFSTNFFSSIPAYIFYFFVALFISYYFLIYGKEILRAMNDYVPLSLRKQDRLIKSIAKHLKVLFRGYFLTGVIQTLVAMLGYIVLGAPNILIISFLTFIASLIPYLGTPLVWVPVSIYMFITGSPISGAILLIYGTLIISTVDNFLRPVLMSGKDTISPPLVFVGFIGGMLAFGIMGIIIGPIIISITSILLKYVKETYQLK
jgi:predicted PurR-regulated permease PerM